jgi:hypothetical protein
MDILNLVSLDWKSERFAIVAHSFRVMAKARNFSELVVGMMHEVYGASSYARGLFSCDVNDAFLWREDLDLFVPRLKIFRLKRGEELSERDLLECNRPQGMNDAQISEWMLAETKWSEKYRRWIDRFTSSRTARNVMIYDLEDKLDILNNPGKYEKEYGPQHFVLPWKRHYLVDIRTGRHCVLHERVPSDDDELLLRSTTETERTNLIHKYSHALERLKGLMEDQSRPGDFTPEIQESNKGSIMNWLNDWIADTIALEELYKDDNLDDIPF